MPIHSSLPDDPRDEIHDGAIAPRDVITPDEALEAMLAEPDDEGDDGDPYDLCRPTLVETWEAAQKDRELDHELLDRILAIYKTFIVFAEDADGSGGTWKMSRVPAPLEDAIELFLRDLAETGSFLLQRARTS